FPSGAASMISELDGARYGRGARNAGGDRTKSRNIQISIEGRFMRTPTHAIRLLIGSVSLALLGACGGGSEPRPDAEGWLTLFNGTDLSNWAVVGDGNWRVEDGAITADQGPAASFVVSDMSFGDFELELEFWVN